MGNKKLLIVIVSITIFVLVVHYQHTRFAVFKQVYRKQINGMEQHIEKATQESSIFQKKIKQLESMTGFQQKILSRILHQGHDDMLIYRSHQSQFAIDDAYLLSGRGFVNDNEYIAQLKEGIIKTGMLKHACVGKSDDGRNTCWGLLRFNNIIGQIPKGAEVISAALNLKMLPEDNDISTTRMLYLYGLNVNWQEEDLKYYISQPQQCKPMGIACAKYSMWSKKEAWESTILAKGVLKGKTSGQGWIKLFFSVEGIKQLEEIIDGGPNQGWIIMLGGEPTPTMLFYHTSESRTIQNIPYLEIVYYIDE